MLKKYKSLTPSLRHRIIVQKPKSLIKLDKHLKKIKKKHAGRNNTGRITIRHRGSKSDHKRFLRIIDRARTLGKYTKCKVIDIQYDPNISGFLALLEPIDTIDIMAGAYQQIKSKNLNDERSQHLGLSESPNKKKENRIGRVSNDRGSEFSALKLENLRFLILAPSNMQIGDIIEGEEYIKMENYMHQSKRAKSDTDSVLFKNISLTHGINRPLKDIPVGSYIYNLKDISGFNNNKAHFITENMEYGKYARSAGTYCILLKTYNKNTSEAADKIDHKVGLSSSIQMSSDSKSEEISVIRLPSKKIISIPSTNVASLGQVSNTDHNLTIKGKAGANRWIGRRPKVGGDAKNPVDHPMGGKTQGSGGKGKPKKTAWGKLAKGQRKRK